MRDRLAIFFMVAASMAMAVSSRKRMGVRQGLLAPTLL
jgi:hypothetical protein